MSVERGSLLTEENQTDQICPVGRCFGGDGEAVGHGLGHAVCQIAQMLALVRVVSHVGAGSILLWPLASVGALSTSSFLSQ